MAAFKAPSDFYFAFINRLIYAQVVCAVLSIAQNIVTLVSHDPVRIVV